MKNPFFLLLFFLFTDHTNAFLNIEALRQSKMEDAFVGSTRLLLNQQKGNVDKMLLSFDSLARFKNDQHNILSLIDYSYGESFDTIDTRQGHLHLRYSYDCSSTLAFEFFHQSEFNKFQDLSARFLFGLGSRHLLLTGDKISLHLGVGAFYEKENLNEQQNINNPRGNLYLSFLWSKTKRYNISSTLYYQPNSEDLHDYRLKSSLGLETFFESNFTQTIEISLNRDTRPPLGIVSTDSVLRAGIGYQY